ncbi:MAG: hypothetical protein R3A80_09840 [Bdellovibrionota bacterium]
MNRIFYVFQFVIIATVVASERNHKIPGTPQPFPIGSSSMPNQDEVVFEQSWEELIKNDPSIGNKITKDNEENLRKLALEAFTGANFTGKAFADFSAPLTDMFNSNELEGIYRDTLAKDAVEAKLAEQSPLHLVGNSEVGQASSEVPRLNNESTGHAANVAQASDPWTILQNKVSTFRESSEYQNMDKASQRKFNIEVAGLAKSGGPIEKYADSMNELNITKGHAAGSNVYIQGIVDGIADKVANSSTPNQRDVIPGPTYIGHTNTNNASNSGAQTGVSMNANGSVTVQVPPAGVQ